jgi:hypothetical protein
MPGKGKSALSGTLSKYISPEPEKKNGANRKDVRAVTEQ